MPHPPPLWPNVILAPAHVPPSAGCIFHYDDDEFKQGNGVGFKESDKPNFTGSYYSKTKAMVEELLRVRGRVGWRQQEGKSKGQIVSVGMLS